MSFFHKSISLTGLFLLLNQGAFAQGRPQPNSHDSYPNGLPRPALQVGQEPIGSAQTNQPRISKEDALKIAMSNVKGELVGSRLENFGGSKCYAFDIKVDEFIKEVLVNDSGQVVIVEKGAAPAKAPTGGTTKKDQESTPHK